MREGGREERERGSGLVYGTLDVNNYTGRSRLISAMDKQGCAARPWWSLSGKGRAAESRGGGGAE